MKTTIEINGRKYDALTGKLLSDSLSDSQKASVAPSSYSRPKMNLVPAIDGVNRRPAVADNQASPAVNQATAQPQKAATHHRAFGGQDIRPMQRTLQKSSTLLRSVVKKPLSKQQTTHSTSANVNPNQAALHNVHAPSAKQVVPLERLKHAKQVARSLSISRFGQQSPPKPKLVGNLKVSSQPVVVAKAPPAAPTLTGLDIEDKATKKQVFNHKIAASAHHSTYRLSKEPLIRRAARRLQVKPKTVGIVAGALAVIVLAGFFAYQNIPSFAIKVAAKSAGFSGRLPGSVPSGYSFKGPIIYSKGIISLNYKSSSDDRKFSITQKPSSWSSESLLTNYLVGSKLRYQTYRDKGLTVFVYNEGDATWVDKGIWYKIAGEGTLSSDQILSIASSL